MTISGSTALDSHIEDGLGQSIEELSRFCAQPSISARNEGVQEAAALLVQMLQRRGLEATVMETGGAPAVYAEGGTGDRTLLLYNHYDVQPPEPLALWDSPPFEPTVRDGKLFARGVADDKGEICCRLAAIDAILATHGRLPCKLKFIVEGEEEVGSVHLAGFVEDHADLLRADACLWEGGGVDFKGRPAIMLGMRGMLYVELYVETLAFDGHSGGANLFPSAAWRLVWALASLKDREEHILIPGIYDQVLQPSDQDVRFLADAVDPEQERMNQEMMGVDQYLGEKSGLEAGLSVFEPTCNIAGMSSGHTGQGPKTIIPAAARAKVDFRLVPNQDPRDIAEKLRRHLDAGGFDDVQFDVLAAESPGKCDADNPYVQACLQTAEEVYGLPCKISPLVGGTGPVHPFIQHLGTPILSAGCGAPGSRIHAPNEHMHLDRFTQGAKHIARLMLSIPSV